MSPAIADLDNDGLLELAFIDHASFYAYNFNLYVWDLVGQSNAKLPWLMYQQNPLLTGTKTDNYNDGVANKNENCLEKDNFVQRDAAVDMYSNQCDLDFDNNGIAQLGLFSVETQPQMIFIVQPAIPVLTALQVTDANTGSFSTTTKTEFFSIDSNDLRDLGFSNLLFGFTPFFAFSSAAIPATAKIGDSGEIGTYIDDFGTQNIIKTWQLEDGGDGRARLVYFSTTQDFRGFRLSSIEQRYLIEQNGDRISMSLRFRNANSILTLTLSGDKT